MSDDGHYFPRMNEVREEIKEALDHQREHTFKAIVKLLDEEREKIVEAVSNQIQKLEDRIKYLEREIEVREKGDIK